MKLLRTTDGATLDAVVASRDGVPHILIGDQALSRFSRELRTLRIVSATPTERKALVDAGFHLVDASRSGGTRS
jgi:hypothetical protein